jgi:biopolymer transport protein ExbD
VASNAADVRMATNRVPVTLSNLDQVQPRVKQGMRSLTRVVRTDTETKHKHLLDLFEAAKKAGIEKIPWPRRTGGGE